METDPNEPIYRQPGIKQKMHDLLEAQRIRLIEGAENVIQLPVQGLAKVINLADFRHKDGQD